MANKTHMRYEDWIAMSAQEQRPDELLRSRIHGLHVSCRASTPESSVLWANAVMVRQYPAHRKLAWCENHCSANFYSLAQRAELGEHGILEQPRKELASVL